MKKYDVFLFDSDDTLYDFDKGSIRALKILFKECGFDYSEKVYAQYIVINAEVWKSYEKGEYTIKDVQLVRFARLFDAIGVQHDPQDFNARYLYELGKSSILVDGAPEICKKIAANGKQIFVISNGILKTHEARMKYSPIEHYATDFFVPEKVGHKKPDKEFFDHVLSHIPNVIKDKILIVGDSLSADIAGGINAGIDTCWFNYRGTPNTIGIMPTYTISKLSELENFI